MSLSATCALLCSLAPFDISVHLRIPRPRVLRLEIETLVKRAEKHEKYGKEAIINRQRFRGVCKSKEKRPKTRLLGHAFHRTETVSKRTRSL